MNMIQLRYEITPAEHLEMVKITRIIFASRLIRICLSIVGLSFAILSYRYLDHSWSVSLITVFVWMIILQSLLPYIIHRRVYYQNPRIFGMRTVTFDDEGIKSDSDIAHLEIRWNSLERFKETKHLFLTYQSRDVVGIVPKRAFLTQDDIAQFRNLLASKIRPQ